MGVTALAGAATNSRARITPETICSARVIAGCCPDKFNRSMVSIGGFLSSGSDLNRIS